MKVVAIHQPQYVPYLGFFHKLAHCDVFIVLDNVQFQKNGIQNRNKVKTKEGWQWLTVPVKHHFGQTIRDVQLQSDSSWARKHWSTLVANYSRAPFFKVYSTELQALYERAYTTLAQVDLALTQWVMGKLSIATPLVFASDFDAAGNQTELLLNLCRAVDGTTYLSGPGGRRYMDTSLFETAGIGVEFQEFVSPTYAQMFPQSGFIPNLSVLDALFCCGEETKEWLS